MPWIESERQDDYHLRMSPDYGKPAFCPKCHRAYLRTKENFEQGRSRRGKPFLRRVCRGCRYRLAKSADALRRLRREWAAIQKLEDGETHCPPSPHPPVSGARGTNGGQEKS